MASVGFLYRQRQERRVGGSRCPNDNLTHRPIVARRGHGIHELSAGPPVLSETQSDARAPALACARGKP